jgi:3-hydroxyacyl-CoA dehydrogenase
MRRELGRGGPMCCADQQGLYSAMQEMKKFALDPLDNAVFWQPAPL